MAGRRGQYYVYVVARRIGWDVELGQRSDRSAGREVFLLWSALKGWLAIHAYYATTIEELVIRLNIGCLRNGYSYISTNTTIYQFYSLLLVPTIVNTHSPYTIHHTLGYLASKH
jgi:hypothetical protein